jgi:Tfp pilus assembly protein PilE
VNRFVTAAIASIAVLSFSAPSYADSVKANMSKMAAPVMAVGKSCPKHYAYVKGYTKKDGTKVKGYCRKAK